MVQNEAITRADRSEELSCKEKYFKIGSIQLGQSTGDTHFCLKDGCESANASDIFELI